MADTMILRIAKAITPDWDRCSNNTRKNAIITARVMLKAAREPTGTMIDACSHKWFANNWRAMIDAALAEDDG